jgi:hypothetical protein
MPNHCKTSFLISIGVSLLILTFFFLLQAEDGKSAPMRTKGISGSDPNIQISYRDVNPLREALLPVPKDAVFKLEGFYLWDPSVIKVGETYHLFASRWPATNGMKGWIYSEVVRATSKSLFGPYRFAGVVLDPAHHPWAKQAVHNPKIIRVGNKFLLYHLGIPVWQTGFAFADSIEGPWAPVAKPVIPINNPAILIKPDGKVYAVGKFRAHGETRYMNAFTADDIMGPYKLVGDSGDRLPHGFELEDPTIWWADNQYNVICTDWQAKVTGIQKALVYYTSKDGINYKLYSNLPVWSQNDLILVEGGESLSVTQVERPQVYLDENGAVTALMAGVHPPGKDATYIIIRPVNNFVPTNND